MLQSYTLLQQLASYWCYPHSYQHAVLSLHYSLKSFAFFNRSCSSDWTCNWRWISLRSLRKYTSMNAEWMQLGMPTMSHANLDAFNTCTHFKKIQLEFESLGFPAIFLKQVCHVTSHTLCCSCLLQRFTISSLSVDQLVSVDAPASDRRCCCCFFASSCPVSTWGVAAPVTGRLTSPWARSTPERRLQSLWVCNIAVTDRQTDRDKHAQCEGWQRRPELPIVLHNGALQVELSY